MEQVGSADPPLAVDRLYGDRHRQLHRLGTGATSRLDGTYSPLLPLFLLLLTGLYMFVLPYAAKWRGGRRAAGRRMEANERNEAGEGYSAKRRTGESRREGGHSRQAASTAKPVLLSGGNPQIAKGDGDAPVQAYIAAMPGWKSDVGRRLDALIVRTVPGVRKAVKWNSPFYGIEGQGWFLSFHCFTKYIKVAFFRGASLRPVPPGESKHKDVRYLDIHEDDQLDQELVASWIGQASELPGWEP